MEKSKMEKVSSEPSVIKLNLDDCIFDEMLKDPSVTSRLEKISDKFESELISRAERLHAISENR